MRRMQEERMTRGPRTCIAPTADDDVERGGEVRGVIPSKRSDG